MTVAGVDIGSLTAKTVLMEDNNILSWSLIPTGPDSAATSLRATEEALERAGLAMKDIAYSVSTGYGRVVVPFAQANITEISCHARGMHYFFPEVRTVLDLGGQDCKAIRVDETGKVANFILNDKCAAGTGRYLESVAKTLSLSLEEIGPLSLGLVEGPASVSSFCTVYAQSDIILFLREGKHINDILGGACEALVRRILQLLQRVGVEEAFCMSGGVAKNIGVVRRLEEKLGLQARIPFEPQIVGAVGAALFAKNRLQSGKR